MDFSRSAAAADHTIDRYGGAGVSDDTPLAEIRTLRISDGPDAVHLRSVARQELRRHRRQDGAVHVPEQADRTRVEEGA